MSNPNKTSSSPYAISLVVGRLVAPQTEVEPTATLSGTLTSGGDGRHALVSALAAWDLEFRARDLSVIVQLGDAKPFAIVDSGSRESSVCSRVMDAIHRHLEGR